MLVYEYKLRLSRAQAAAIDEAIRTTQFIRNKAVRRWMDGRGVSANDLQLLCARLAQEYPFAARLTRKPARPPPPAPGRPSSASIRTVGSSARGRRGIRATSAIAARSSTRRPDGSWTERGSVSRSAMAVGLGRYGASARAIWRRSPLEQIKRVRLLRRADGYFAQFVLQVERRLQHAPSGSALGIDVGIAAYVTDSDGQAVANPRFISQAEARLKRSQRRLSRRSVYHKRGKKPRNNHVSRQRARHNQYPPASTATTARPPQPPPAAPSAPSAPSATRQSANWGKAKQRVGRVYLHLQRQREDFARKQASALISSHDLIALEDLQVRNLVRNRQLAKAISDVSWSRLRWWVEYYGRAAWVAGGGGSTSVHHPGLQRHAARWDAVQSAHLEVAQHADAYLSALWADPGPRPQCGGRDPAAGAGAGPGGRTLAT